MILVIVQVVILAGIASAVYFFWYKPSQEREQWERSQYAALQQQLQQAADKEAKAAEEARTRERQAQFEREVYLKTTRGRMESQGYEYM